MRAISRAIDRFCYKHPRFGIPRLMLYIVFGTGLVFILSIMDDSGTLFSRLAFSPDHIFRGEVWRLVSFLFIPISSSPLWLAVSLYFYYMLGTTLEQTWGTAKFCLYYLISVVLLVVSGLLFYLFGAPFHSWLISVLSIHLTLLVAFATLFPDTVIHIMFIIPVKVKWIGIFAAVMFFYDILRGFPLFPSNLIPLPLVLNYLAFCGDTLKRYLNFYNKRNSKTTINFKNARRELERKQQVKSYTRKCEVCGISDADDPSMEFRYCSRCEGYHCFCINHINNHTHFK